MGRTQTFSSEFKSLPTLDAIVQLQGLTLPPIQVQGQSQLELSPYEQTQVFTIQAKLKEKSGTFLSGTFLIDTGASTTLLSSELVQALELQGKEIPGDRLASAVAGKNCPSMDARLHQLPILKLGTLQVSQLQGLEFKNTVIPKGLSGVLGMNLLRSFDLKINPRDQRIDLLPPSELPPKSQSLAIPLEERLGVMLGQIYLNGEGPFQMLIDTGAGSTFISPSVMQRAKLDHLPQQSLQIQGFCGLENAKQITLPSLQLGLQALGENNAIVLDGASVLQTLNIDGILGQNVLNQFFQYWRFPSQKSLSKTGSLLLVPQR